MVKFLTSEWADTLTRLLNSSDAFRESAAGADICIVQHVVDTPGGDVSFSMRIRHGLAEVALGSDTAADVEVTSDYPTAVSIARGDIGLVSAVSKGGVEMAGDIGKLMSHQGLLAGIEGLRQGFDVEFH